MESPTCSNTEAEGLRERQDSDDGSEPLSSSKDRTTRKQTESTSEVQRRVVVTMLPNASIVCTADERKIFDTLLDVVKVYELPVTLRVAGKGLSHLPHSASLIAHTRLTFVFYNLRRVGAGQASREKLVGHRHRAGYVYGPGFREQGERVLGHERRGNQGGWGDSKQPGAEQALGNGDDARARELA